MRFVFPRKGGCQCGEIPYRLIGEPYVGDGLPLQRMQAAVRWSFRMHEADVQLISGAPKRWTRPSDSGNLVICWFCGTCGNRLWHEPAGSGFLHIKPGTLDDQLQLAPRHEAWTKRKVSWLTIDGLEASFEDQPPSHRPTSASQAMWLAGSPTI